MIIVIVFVQTVEWSLISLFYICLEYIYFPFVSQVHVLVLMLLHCIAGGGPITSYEL
jgi:hypothetical protein